MPHKMHILVIGTFLAVFAIVAAAKVRATGLVDDIRSTNMGTFLTKSPEHKRISYACLEWLLRERTILTLRHVFMWQRIVTRTVLIALLLLVAGGQNRSLHEAVANELDLKTQIFALQKADKIILMILPANISFYAPITIEHLPEVACVYRIYDNDSGKARVIALLADTLLDGNEHVEGVLPQVCILFKQHSQIIDEFYFFRYAKNGTKPLFTEPALPIGEITGRYNYRRVKLHEDALIDIRALPADTNATLIHWIQGQSSTVCLE